MRRGSKLVVGVVLLELVRILLMDASGGDDWCSLGRVVSVGAWLASSGAVEAWTTEGITCVSSIISSLVF